MEAQEISYDTRPKYPIKEKPNQAAFKNGLKSGIPIGLGYFAVSFSLGVLVIDAGFNPLQGAVVSLFCNASAGEYAGFKIIAGGGSIFLLALMTFIANARYLLMSSALSQRLKPGISMGHRMIMGLYVTDEIFGVSMGNPGYLNPWFTYGCAAIASPLWAIGTALGCIAGNFLPQRVVSALSVALFGMFLAVIIPAAKKEKIIAGVIIVSFALSSAFTYILDPLIIDLIENPVLKKQVEGIQIIILTIVIAAAAAILFPRENEKPDDNKTARKKEQKGGCR